MCPLNASVFLLFTAKHLLLNRAKPRICTHMAKSPEDFLILIFGVSALQNVRVNKS